MDRSYEHFQTGDDDDPDPQSFQVIHRNFDFAGYKHVARADCWCRPLVIDVTVPQTVQSLTPQLLLARH